MGRFISKRFDCLKEYVPGEQPQDRKYIKLNTNESPFPPSPYALRLARQAAGDLQLYSDPDCSLLTKTAADYYGVSDASVIFGNGSDELLDFAFAAFCDKDTPALFADITYGFYPVFAAKNGVPLEEIPLKEDLTVDLGDYKGKKGTVFIANPNAPTAIALPASEIEKLVAEDPGRLVVVDEAYVDFGGESVLPLIKKYDNLLVIQTFSKSRSLAGGRLGMGFACSDIINDLRKIKYSFNPYNVNAMTAAAGVGALLDVEYFRTNTEAIKKTRAWTVEAMGDIGFTCTDSKANFIFARHRKIPGSEIYLKLKERGILVRYFDKERLKPYVRITVGSVEEMRKLVGNLKEIVEEGS